MLLVGGYNWGCFVVVVAGSGGAVAAAAVVRVVMMLFVLVLKGKYVVRPKNISQNHISPCTQRRISAIPATLSTPMRVFRIQRHSRFLLKNLPLYTAVISGTKGPHHELAFCRGDTIITLLEKLY